MTQDRTTFTVLTREVEELGKAYEAARKRSVKLPIKQMARRSKASVRKNFRVGGRPNKWQALVRRKGKPLMGGKLYGSIRHRILGGKNFQIYSTDDPGKVAAHNQGRTNYTITPNGAHKLAWQDGMNKWQQATIVHSHSIPARPFMHLQADDIEWMVKRVDESVARHLRKHKVAK